MKKNKHFKHYGPLNLALATVILATIMVSAVHCKKEHSMISSDNYSSLEDFYNRNALPLMSFQIEASSGGKFMSPQGTIVNIPANGFTDALGNLATGTVKIEFLDIYKKSDMLFSGIPTTSNGWPLKSGGEFFIRASLNGAAVDLIPVKKIEVNQPANDIDTMMNAFIGVKDSGNAVNWVQWDSSYIQPSNELRGYVFSLYNFSSPLDSGTWCNSDNPDYFSAYSPTKLTIAADDDPAAFETDVFLIFKNVNSMIHVYKNPDDNLFPYFYAPTGLDCSVVAVGVKNGKLYSSFVPVTISPNETVHFRLSETTTATFKQKLESLNQ